MSLDGFIAGPQGEYDWIPDEPEIDWSGFMARFDTLLMGRRSYEAALAAPSGSLPSMTTYVFSRTLRPEDHPDVTIVGDDLESVMEDLRQGQGGKEIWLFGGGELFRSLLERGYVDVVEVGLVPVLLGRGVPFMPGLNTRMELRLADTRRYPTGIMLLTYEIARNAG